jgi:hypothetical protein
MTEKPHRTPQEKKSLSYVKDRRSVYDGSDKAARKAIPRRKAGENRKSRRKANQSVKAVEKSDEETGATIESSLRHDVERVGGWVKNPGVSLRTFMEFQARWRSGLNPPPKSADQPDGDED